jgi:hypothetical protein
MPYRLAASVLTHFLPVDAGTSSETLRSHTLKIGAQLDAAPAIEPTTGATSMTVTVDQTFIRSCESGERHLEVRVGNVETSDGGRQVFGAVARSDTDIAVRIRRCLDAVGRTAKTAVTAFTDGGSSSISVQPRSIPFPPSWKLCPQASGAQLYCFGWPTIGFVLSVPVPCTEIEEEPNKVSGST